MINSLNSRKILTINSLKIRCNPGATTAHLLDHVNPAVHKKPDMLIIHTGTNDHAEDPNTIKKSLKACKCDQKNL